MKHKITIFAAMFAFTLSAAVPVRWTVETSRVQPAQIEAYHGETLRLEAALQSYGKAFEPTNNLYAIYWQTNGMDTAYWTGPAVISNNVLLAEWTPAMDVGATVYQGFIGAPGEIYRASFQLRLRPSPGAVPSELPLPVKTLDFAHVEVLNPPYFTQSETDAKIASATNGLESAAHAAQTYQIKGSYLTAESDPSVSSWAKAASKPSYTWSEVGSKPSWIGDTKPAYSWSEIGSKPTFAAVATSGAYSDLTGKPSIPTDSTVAGWGYIKSWTETDPTISAWAKATSKPSYTWNEIGSKPSWIGSTKPSYTWTEIGSKPTTFAPASHVHAMTDVTGLSTALADKVGASSFVLPLKHEAASSGTATKTINKMAPEFYIYEMTGEVPSSPFKIAADTFDGTDVESKGGEPCVLIKNVDDPWSFSGIGWCNGNFSKPKGWYVIENTIPVGDAIDISGVDFVRGQKVSFNYNSEEGPWTIVLRWQSAERTSVEIPTALKCPNSLTINVNGTLAATYDGSAAKTVNISTGGGGPAGTVAAATLEYHADGQAIAVSVAAAGTFSATLTDWPDGQSQMAFVTLAAGATVSPAIKLVGYSDWTTDEEFMAVATRRNNKIYLNPVCITEE